MPGSLRRSVAVVRLAALSRLTLESMRHPQSLEAQILEANNEERSQIGAPALQ
jgi:hypothetical protein